MNSAADADFAVFTEALRLPPEERDRYLDGACKGDIEFRRRVETLLLTYEQAGDFLQRPAAERPITPAGLLAAVEKPGDRIGHYKLLQQIGEGGCGVVYMAEQEIPVRRRVALKIIKPGMDTKNVIARFEAERQALALMNHPNIAKVFDAGATEAGRPYFVMELVRGVKITEYCNQQSLTTEDRLKLFVQVCQAVQHAHQRGIIHRDIKPSNILVTQSLEGVAMPMVIDFGVAKATTDQRLTDKTVFTSFEMLIGTPAYMSPEQAALSSVDVDTRTDIYSLGVLLYELLTSSTPFETDELLKAGLDEIRRVIREQEPLRPSTRLSKMPGASLTTVAQQRQSEPPRLIHIVRGDLDWIVMKALEKDRTRRYETANGLALDIKRFLENEPVLARPASRLYKFQKTVQRNKLLFLGTSLIAVLLVSSLIVLLALLGKERQARQQSEQVTGVLEEMFNGVAPSKALGRSTEMLRDILDRTAEHVGSELSNQPAVQAQLCSLIAKPYLDLGMYDKAAKMDRIALVDERELYGPKSTEVAASHYHLGMVLLVSAKVPEAEKELREALSIREHLFSTTNANVAASLDGLGRAYRDEWRLTEADPLIRRALEIRRQLFPGNNLVVADSLQQLCRLLEAEGHWPEAEAAAREFLNMCRHIPGRKDLEAEALDDLAMAAGFNGKLDVREQANKEAFAIKEKVLPEDHPYMVKSLADLGEILRLRGNSIEAHAVLLGVISIQRKLLGEDYHDTLASMGSLGQVLASEGKWEEAENVHRAALTSWRKHPGDPNPQCLWEYGELCRALVAQRKYHEAEELMAEVLIPEFVTNTACSSVLAHRLDLRARQGRWNEAAADAATLMHFEPKEYYWCYTVAALLVMTHDLPPYEQLCRRIPALFAETSNPYIAQRLADGCLLLPNSGADPRWVQQLATKAVTLGGSDSSGYFQACKGLSEYREGRFSEAGVWGENALQKSEPFAQAEGCAVLAMARWRLGLRDTARAALSQGNKLAPELSSTGTVDLGDRWLDWVVARILLDEATELVAQGSTPVNNARTQ